MRSDYKTLVIFSTDQTSKSPEDNAKNFKAAKLGLEAMAIHFTEVEGMYKGTKEQSLMVFTSGEYSFNQCVTLAKFFNQETILMRDNQNQAQLLFLDNSRPPERLGKLTEVSQELAEQNENYTYVPNTNKYFITQL